MQPSKPWTAATINFLTQDEMRRLLDAGADLRFVQDWIGHASIRNTVIYAQLTSRRRDEEARKMFASKYVI